MPKQTFYTENVTETELLGEEVGKNLQGGETIEFLSDLGGGKTSFVTGLARGFGSDDPVASPSFTISYVYTRPDKKELHHFDFYRLEDAGVVAHELAEIEGDPNTVVAVEWGEIVHNVLPDDRIIITLVVESENRRKITVDFPEKFSYLLAQE